MTTPRTATLRRTFHRVVPTFLLVVLGAAACGSLGGDAVPGPAVEVPTTMALVVSTTTVTVDEARSGFVADVAAATPILDGLTDADLGCVADRLLVDLEPAEVVALTQNGPRPDQAVLAVGALQDCNLVVRLVALGMAQTIAEDPDAQPMDVDCLLEGVDDDDLVPVLEARFASGSLVLDDPKVDDLLADTPMMANAVRCMTDAMLDAGVGTPAVCAGLADRLGDMMAILLALEPGPGEEPDPFDLVAVFRVTDEVFDWLADEVPSDLLADAALVRDTNRRIGDLMAEAFQYLRGEDAGSHQEDHDARTTAFLGAMARIEAELSENRVEVNAASARLRGWTVSTCGEKSSMLFDLLAGAGVSA
ncbi:MAG: hypothetical protein VYA89_02655 [Actinomycetota bacterium]|nr:hypothetical protein [Actinomycetota bacterium]